jgi:cation-transporting ATPase 13A3/4/5
LCADFSLVDLIVIGRPDFSQLVHLEEEDIQLRFTGYKYVQMRLYIYYLACLLSAGVLFLLGRWMPKYYISFVAITCRMGQAEFVVIEVSQHYSYNGHACSP